MRRFTSGSRPSAPMVVAVISLAFAVTGVSWAATKIGTKQLERGAVTGKKLHKKAVTGGKIDPKAVKGSKIKTGAVGERQLDPAVAGVAVAGVSVDSSGAIFGWFNRVGGQPIVRHTGNGSYQIDVPGLTDSGDFNVIPIASLAAGGGEILAGTAGGRFSFEVVQTFDSDGAPADRGFNWTVFGASR